MLVTANTHCVVSSRQLTDRICFVSENIFLTTLRRKEKAIKWNPLIPAPPKSELWVLGSLIRNRHGESSRCLSPTQQKTSTQLLVVRIQTSLFLCFGSGSCVCSDWELSLTSFYEEGSIPNTSLPCVWLLPWLRPWEGAGQLTDHDQSLPGPELQPWGVLCRKASQKWDPTLGVTQ